MSYLVLARKYRPRDFGALVGQEHVVQALANALTQRRLHHAYLFTGTRGIGKTTVSRILAKSLNCTGPDGQGGITATPCGTCAACRDIDAGRHVDYVELDAASNRGVEEIGLLLDQAVYKPVVGRFKVYMIDEVHMLTTHAFNAMLKTLEEPPEYLKFILATTDPQKLPPTVLSRCLQFNLRPMAPPTVQRHLAEVLAAENIAAEPGALRLIARAAHGSMRDALSLTDQAIAYGAGTLAEAGVRQMLGAVDRGHAVRLLDALARRDGAGVVHGVDALRGLGLSAAGTLEEMAALLQSMAVEQAVPGAIDPDDPDTPDAVRLAALLAADETQLLYSIVLHGRAELALAPDEYSGLVMVLLRMLAFAPAGQEAPPAFVPPPQASKPPVPAPAVKPPQAARPTAPAPAVAPPSPTALPVPPAGEPPPWVDMPWDATDDGAAPPAAPSADPADRGEPARAAAEVPSPVRARPRTEPAAAGAAAAVELVPTPLGDRWDALVRPLVEQGRITALARELALQAQCIAVDDGASPPLWRLRVERESLRAPAQRDRLQAALAEALGQPLRLDIELGETTDTPARRDTAERSRRQRQAERTIHDDPQVRSLLAQYASARIVPGSIEPH